LLDHYELINSDLSETKLKSSFLMKPGLDFNTYIHKVGMEERYSIN